MSARSRRELLAAAGAVPLLLGAQTAFAQARDDAEVLEAAIRLEQRAVAAFESAGGPAAELVAEQDGEHVQALAAALRDLGGDPPPALERPENGPRPAAGLAIELKSRMLAAYYDASAKLRSADLVGTVASIMASEAQHLVILRASLGEDPAPEAFVTGGGRP